MKIKGIWVVVFSMACGGSLGCSSPCSDACAAIDERLQACGLAGAAADDELNACADELERVYSEDACEMITKNADTVSCEELQQSISR